MKKVGHNDLYYDFTRNMSYEQSKEFEKKHGKTVKEQLRSISKERNKNISIFVKK
tara:strand:- start:368 stop:532 length:165 start_codon:yes stop_codon:yes gene_type:complete